MRQGGYGKRMINLLLIALGGALGSLARYGLGLWAKSLWPTTSFPIGTFLANILGGLMMGLLMGLLMGPLKDVWPTERLRLWLGVGVLGGFTTFSTFSLETFGMIERKAWLMALGYSLSSVILSVLSLGLGLYIMKKGGL